MPILTNFEVSQMRAMTAFAGSLLDLIAEIETECEQGFEDTAEMTKKRFEIAEELGIKLPLGS